MSKPVRLSKSMQENKVERWIESHLSLLLFICIIILFLLCVAVIVAWFNVAAAPTGTEANVYYNGFERII